MTESPEPNKPDPSKPIDKAQGESSFFAELKRRKVFRVAATYIVVAWIIIQVAAATFPGFEIPMWAFRFVVLMLILGFPISIVLAWAFELTPDGIKLTKKVSSEQRTGASQAKRNWTAIGFAAALPTVIFGVLAVFFYFKVERVTNEMEGIVATQQTAPDKSIAVLPFDNRSELKSDEFFTDGIHDDLLTQISRIRDIKTISRTSVMTYRDTTKNMRAIGEELGVATLLEGGVQRSGNRVRINMQLIDAETDANLWAETYTRELSAENLFEIQSEIATAIAGALRAVLSPEEQKRIEKLPTQNMAALEAFFHGRASYALNTSEGYSEAIEYFQEAVDLDPTFAEAYAQLALATLEKIYYGGSPVENQTALAAPFVNRALELDPELSESYQALGYLEKYRYDHAASKAAFERAIQLNPNNAAAFVMYGNLSSWELNAPEEAISLFGKAMSLDPQNRAAEQQLGEALMNERRFAEAQAVFEALIVKDPGFAQTYTSLGNLLSWNLYRFDEAIKMYRQALDLDPRSIARFETAAAYLSLGMPAAAIPWSESYLELAPNSKHASTAMYDVLRHRKEYTAAEEALKANKARELYWRHTIDIMLAELDMDRGHPELATERFIESFPMLVDPTYDINSNEYEFKVAIVYAAALHASEEKELADSMTKRVLEVLPSKHRYRWAGIEYLDAWLYLSMGDEAKALNALREWREAGGCLDLTQSTYLRPLFDHPEFQALNNEMLADLAKQRANLARMKANGELAPIPEL
ncbi:tetratricopeptide repeat protein [Pelagicoccus sp. SDUM812002]|uniref:tetratricopeptide repeat protein n=1 Tax=Pelagicoccus sp. SDUM812002 TaxID=3041266 RepID=UPI00280FFD06|nr:tetratricopeptide repeat protein [Pelagicoccus sp. SDUM812002]MDQ8188043.1 tetratricopeptide repeat protein [Pelagicoccus sp. SDUM812002]